MGSLNGCGDHGCIDMVVVDIHRVAVMPEQTAQPLIPQTPRYPP
jgi:hypothetical protein